VDIILAVDVFAHILWTGGIAKTINNKRKIKEIKPLSIFWTSFWGVAPDLFAFGPAFFLMFIGLLTGSFHLSSIPQPDFHGTEDHPEGSFPYASLSFALYNISHSIIIFMLVFVLIWIIRRVPYVELSGWLLHILIDIPTHSSAVYPTPFLYPLSSFKISGISWSEPWFMFFNYGALLLFFHCLGFSKRKKLL
jgi:hypothetical protein